MAEHGHTEYATATGNDYPAHENTYERFLQFSFVGTINVLNIVFGLAVGGVMGHWKTALLVFIIGIIGAIPGLVSSSKTSSYIAFALCFLIFAYTAVSH